MEKLKRILSFLLSFTIFFNVCQPSLTVFAAGEEMELYKMDFPRWDETGETYGASFMRKWGHAKLNLLGGWVVPAKEYQFTVYSEGPGKGGQVVYCMEPGLDNSTGTDYTSKDENYWDDYPDDKNPTISPDVIKQHIGRIMQYGWQGSLTTWNTTTTEGIEAISGIIATQMLIWETVVGERDMWFNKVDASAQGKNNVTDMIKSDHPLRTQVFEAYNSIATSMQNHLKLPSFMSRSSASASSYKFAWDGEKYSATLEDTNNVLGNYTFSSTTDGVSFSVSGNKLTISSPTVPSGTISVTAAKNNSMRKGVVVWSNGSYGSGKQNLATYGASVTDPVSGFANFSVENGSLKVIKTSEDGKVEGISFTVIGNGINITKTTNTKGEIDIADLPPGTYTVTEESLNNYAPVSSQTVNVIGGQTASVSFSNTLKRGDVTIMKTAEDNKVSGITFKLTGISASGEKVELTAQTNAQGIATFKDVLIGTYIVEEVGIADYYISPENKTVTVKWNETAEATFNNTLKKGNVSITKTSEDGKVEGITFKLTGTSAAGTKIELTARTNTNGVATFENVLIGDYTVEEVGAADYYISPDKKTITVEQGKTASTTFENNLKKGNVTITKVSEDGKVEGITFKLTGTSAAGTKVELIAKTNAQGIATFKDVLIGEYSVEEVGADDYYVSPDKQSVTVVWKETSTKTFNNVLKRGDVSVTKQSEDGKVEGITFWLHGTSASGHTVSEYAITDANGLASFTDILIGEYILEEVGAEDYYILPASQTTEVKWNTVTNKTFENKLKYGSVTVSKTAEDGLVEGVTFKLTGTSASGAQVDLTAKTNAQGIATFDKVLIGENYTIEEVNTANRYEIPVSQSVSVEWNKTVNKAFHNALKKGSVSITKVSENGKVEGITFKLFGTSAAGTKVELTAKTNANGVATFENVLIGEYTVQEIGVADYYIAPDNQTITVKWKETAEATFENKLKYGSVTITKTAEDGFVSNVAFRLEGISASGAAVNLVAVTNDKGIAVFDKVLIGENYTITEIGASEHYVIPDAQNAKVEWNKATEKSFYNALKRGDLTVTKTSEDGLVEGIIFRLYGTSASGEKVEMTAKTNAQGVATFKDVLIGTGYTIEEVDVADRYVIPEEQSAVIEWNKVTNKSFENKLKRGSDLIVTKIAEDGLVAGIKFRLYGTSLSGAQVDITAITNEKGIATFKDVLIGTYTIEEVDTADRYIVPEKQTAVIEWGNVTKKTFDNTLKRGSVKVTKTSEDGLVEGVTFKLSGTALSGEKVELTAKTDKNGVATFSDVLIGTGYVIEEVDTADRYIVPEKQTINVEWNKVTEKNFYNKLKRGNVTVIKTAEDGKVEGIKFRLFGTSLSGEKVDMTITTNDKGIASFENILIGSYRLQEVGAKDYYIVPAEQAITIEWNKTTEAKFDNTLKRGSVTVTKTSEDGLVEGIIFKLSGTSASGEKFELTAKTNANGVATFSNVLVGTGYVIEEVDTADRYIVPEKQTINVEWNKVTEKSFHNELKCGDLKVTKTAEDGKVAGIKFHLFGTSLSGVKVDMTATTNDKGIAIFEDMLIGTGYTIEEVDTAARYIVPEKQTAAIEWNKVTEKSFHNELKRGDLKVTKTAEDGKVEGMKFRLFGTSLSGAKVDLTVETNVQGIATFKDILIGNYTVEEVDTADRYIIPAQQAIEIQWNKTAELIFDNSLKRGSLTVTKTAEDGKVEGMKFRLFGTSLSGEKVDMTAETNEKGIATFSNVLIGTGYTIEEIDTAARYIVPAKQTAAIEWNKVTEKSFHNELKRGDLKVTKTSEDGLVEGVSFKLSGTALSGEKVNMTAKTNKNGVATFENVLIGTGYVIEEVGTADRYIVPEKQTAAVEWNKMTEKSFYNALKRGSVKVTKSSEDGLVAGVKFRLYGTSLSGEKIDMTVKTNDKGIAVFENVLIGSKYTIEEVDVAERYVVPEKQSAVIEWNKVIEKAFENKLKRGGDLIVTKTSEDGKISGIKFRLFGTSLSGAKVDVTVETNEKGIAIFKDILIGTYTLEEVDTAARYIVPEKQTVVIEVDKTTEKTFHNALKRGDLKVTKTAEDGKVAGIKFHLYGTSLSGEKVDMTVKTNEKGIAVFKDVLIGDNYTIEEVDTAIRYIVPDKQTATIEWNKATEKSFYNELKRGSVIVTKTSEDGLVEGMKFRLFGTSLSGAKVDLTVETNEKGIATFKDILIGNYTIEEVDTADRYIIPAQQAVEVQWKEIAEVDFDNVLKRGSLTITKTSEDGLVEGVKFRLFGTSLSGAKVDLTAETNEKGIATFSNVLIGTDYTIEEVDTAARYIVPEKQSASIEWNKISEKSFHNELKRGDLKVTKTSEDDKISGIKFRLFGTSLSGAKVDLTAETNEKGIAVFEDILIGDNYIIEEVGTAVHYIVPEKQTAAIEWNKMTEKSFHNALKRGSVTVIKTAEDGLVEGVKFRLYGTSLSGAKVDITVETNEKGIATFKDILIGDNYTIEEADTAARYIVPEKQNAAIEWNKVTEKSFHNELKRGDLTVTKTSEDGLVKGMKFRLYGTSLSGEKIDLTVDTNEQGIAVFKDVLIGDNYIIEEVDTAARYIVPEKQSAVIEWNKVTEKSFYNELKRGSVTVIKTAEDGLVEGVKFHLLGTSLSGKFILLTAVTNEQGIAKFEDVLIGSEYVLAEVDTADRYLVPATQDVIVEWNKVTEKSFHNELKHGNIVGKKLDEDGFAICGALFGLFYENETEFIEENALMLAESNEIGVFGFENVPYGRYVIREIKAAPAFVKGENSYSVTIAEDGEVVDVVIENKFIVGSVETTKVDKDYPENKLTGAIFEIYVDVDGNKEFDAQIDKLVGEMHEVETGVYRMNDLRYNGYFLHEKTAPEGFLKDNGYHYFEIRENGKTVSVENEAGVGFANQPMKGTLEITKTDVADGKPLANVGFRVKDEQGNIVAEGCTDENGIARFENLRYGKYTYQEFDALNGYQLDDKEYPFEITENGQIVKAQMTNEKIDNPQTGDDTNVNFWFALTGVALSGSALILTKKKKDTEEA